MNNTSTLFEAHFMFRSWSSAAPCPCRPPAARPRATRGSRCSTWTGWTRLGARSSSFLSPGHQEGGVPGDARLPVRLRLKQCDLEERRKNSYFGRNLSMLKSTAVISSMVFLAPRGAYEVQILSLCPSVRPSDYALRVPKS